MATHKQQFSTKIKEPTFRSAFENASASERQELLEKAGLLIPLAEAEAIFDEASGELNPDELQQAAGGGGGIDRPPPEPAPSD